MADASAADEGGSSTAIGKLAVGIVAGVFLALVVGGVTLWAINSGIGDPVAVAPAPQPEPLPKPEPEPEPPSPPNAENPEPAPAPSPKPAPEPSPTPMPVVPEPATPMPVSPTPVQPTPVAPTPAAAAAVGALDDVRQRGKFLPLPPAKEMSAVLLCTIEVAKPGDCELELFGLDGLLPGGASGTLKSSDPTPEERIWTVTLIPNSNLTKERPVADFALKDKQLSFRWRPGSPSIPLDYCLLRIDAPGEQELCQLSQPLEVPAAALKVHGEVRTSFKLPPGAANLAGCKLEILPQNFPPHTIDGDSVLESGKGATFQVTGTASGTIEPAMALEVEFTLSAGEATIKLSSRADYPPSGAKETPSKRKSLNAKQLETAKKSLDQQVIKSAKGVRDAERWVDMLTAEEMRLMQNFQQQRLVLVRIQLAKAKNDLMVEQNAHDRQTAALAWHEDMLALVQEFESKATLGFRLVRPIGQDNVEIARTVP